MEDYHYIQTVRNQSFEKDSIHFVEGQHNALKYFFANVNRDQAILDSGCGDGTGLLWFKTNGFTNVIGVDINPRKLRVARTINNRANLCDMQDMEIYLDGEFDHVWSSHSLEHAEKPIATLKQFRRVLKPGGYLNLVVPFRDCGPLDVHCGQVELCTNQDDPEKVVKVIQDEGFKVEWFRLDTFREPEIWIKARKL